MTSPVRLVSGRPVLVVGLVAAAVAGAMAGVTSERHSLLIGFVLVAQLAFVTAWAYVLDTPGLVGAVAISAGAAAASDGVLLKAHHVSLTDFATIIAFAFLLALFWQIARPHRTRVTESLASTLTAAVLAVAGGAYLTLRAGLNGEQSAYAGTHAATAALLGVAVVLGVGRLVDAVLPRPLLFSAGERGLPGLVLGLAAAAGVGAWYGSQASAFPGPTAITTGPLSTSGAVWVALIAAAVAAIIDIGVDVGLATLDNDPVPQQAAFGVHPVRFRRPAPLPARIGVVALLPVLLSGPPAYVIARAVLT